ncbi:hypothetical protein [Streptomyces halobius]|nr:hypothetical protein [Streptomyces halobius]
MVPQAWGRQSLAFLDGEGDTVDDGAVAVGRAQFTDSMTDMP